MANDPYFSIRGIYIPGFYAQNTAIPACFPPAFLTPRRRTRLIQRKNARIGKAFARAGHSPVYILINFYITMTLFL